jgi:hypothetical protein
VECPKRGDEEDWDTSHLLELGDARGAKLGRLFSPAIQRHDYRSGLNGGFTPQAEHRIQLAEVADGLKAT